MPWLIGPLFFTIFISLRGFKFKMPKITWFITRIVIGVYLGSKIDSSFFSNLVKWSGSFLMLMLLLAFSIFLVSIFYKKYCHFDSTTAVAAAAPGGMGAIFLMIDEMGRKINEKNHFITHLTRIFLVISLIPFIVRAYIPEGYTETFQEVNFVSFNFFEIFKIFSVSIITSLIANQLKLPAPILIGSLIGVGSLYAFNFTTYELPKIGLNVCLAIIGCNVGMRFQDFKYKDIINNLKFSIISFFLVITLTFIFSFISSLLFNLNFLSLLMSYAPGGIFEMTSIAIAFDYDAKFVIAHHIARLYLLIIFVPLFCKFFIKN